MAKYTQPNMTFDGSVGFIKNTFFDSSTYLKGGTYITTSASGTDDYALVLSATGNSIKVNSRQLGSMAWNTATDYVLQSLFDSSISSLEADITRIDLVDAAQDASIIALENATTLTWNGITTTDNSVGLGGDLNFATTITTSATNTLTLAGLQGEASEQTVVAIGAGGELITTELGTMAFETASNYVLQSLFDSSISSLEADITRIDLVDAAQDASIVGLRSDFGDYLPLAGGTLTGDLTINTNLTVKGNTYFDGSVYMTDVESIEVSTGYIVLSTGITGVVPGTLQSGIVVNRGTSDPFAFLYDETSQTFRVGITNLSGGSYVDASMQTVATREDAPTTDGIAVWNNTEDRFDTTTNLVYNSGTGLTLDNQLILTALNNKAAELTALVIDGTTVGTRELETTAFTAKGNLTEATSSVLTIIGGTGGVLGNVSIEVDQSDAGNDGYLSSTDWSDFNQKLDTAASVSGETGHEVFSAIVSDEALFKYIKQGTGTVITSDASSVTISVANATTLVKKYSATFDGTAGITTTILASTHLLGTGPFNISVYDTGERVYTDESFNGSGDVTLTWTASSLTADCKVFITG